jgi:Zn-dependent protease/CBS domain-containing protein
MRLLGFEIRFDLTWLIIVALIVFSLSAGYFPAAYADLPASTYIWMGVLGASGLFISIILHELAHSVVGRHMGMTFHGITLFAFGGAAELEEEPPTPRVEFWMTIAGPATSIVLAILFYLAGMLLVWMDTPAPIVAVISYLVVINVLLAAFNLLPAFPLDGGRILRAALWAWRGDVLWATRIATFVGGGLGLALVLLGIVSAFYGNLIGGMWWFLIGLFIRAAASMAYQRLLARHMLAGIPVRRLMKGEPSSVAPSLTVADLVEDYLLGRSMKYVPVVAEGSFVGQVGVEEVRRIPAAERSSRLVGDILTPADALNTVSPDAEAGAALEQMERAGRNCQFVVAAGRLVGVVTRKDVLQYLSVARELQPPTGRAAAHPAE